MSNQLFPSITFSNSSGTNYTNTQNQSSPDGTGIAIPEAHNLGSINARLNQATQEIWSSQFFTGFLRRELQDRVQIHHQHSSTSAFDETNHYNKTNFFVWFDFFYYLKAEDIEKLTQFFDSITDFHAESMEKVLKEHCYDLVVQLPILNWRCICDRLLSQGKIELFKVIVNFPHPNKDWREFLLTASNQEGRTPLDIVCSSGHTPSLEYMLTIPIIHNLITFQFVIQTGNARFLEVYIKNLEGKSELNELSLNAAILGPNPDESVAVLLRLQPNNRSLWQIDREKQSPLFLGVQILSPEVVQKLIETCPLAYRERLWSKNKQGFTVLQSAAMHHPDPGPIIQLLCKQYPYPIRELWHFTIEHSPFHILINAQHSCCLEYKMRLHTNHLDSSFRPLYRCYRDPSQTTQALNTLLEYCPESRLLSLCGVVPHSQTNILHLAAANGDLGIVQFVLGLSSHKRLSQIELPNLWSLNSIGSSPLHYAAFGGNTDIFDLLVNECPYEFEHLVWNANKLGLQPLHYSLLSQNENCYPHVRNYYSELNESQLYVHARRDKRGKKYSLLHFAAMGNSAHNINLVHAEYCEPLSAPIWAIVDKKIVEITGRTPFDIAVLYGNVNALEALKNEWFQHNKNPPVIIQEVQNGEVFRYLKDHHNQFRVLAWEAVYNNLLMRAFHNYKSPDLVRAYLSTWSCANNQDCSDGIEQYTNKIGNWRSHYDQFAIFQYFSPELWKTLAHKAYRKNTLQANNLLTLRGLLFFSPAKYIKYVQHANSTSILCNTIRFGNADRVRRLFLMTPESKKKYLYSSTVLNLTNPLLEIIKVEHYGVYHESIELMRCVIKYCPPKQQHLLWDFKVLKQCIEMNRHIEAAYLISACPIDYLEDFLNLNDTSYYSCITSPIWINLLSQFWPKNKYFLLDVNINKEILQNQKSVLSASEDTFVFTVASGAFKFNSELNFQIDNFAFNILLRNAHYARETWQNRELPLGEFLGNEECIKKLLEGADAHVFTWCPPDTLKDWIKHHNELVGKALKRNSQIVTKYPAENINLLFPLFSPSLIRTYFESLINPSNEDAYLMKFVTIDDGVIMEVNDEGAYVPTGASYPIIHDQIKNAFERVYLERLKNINWNRDSDSDLPVAEIKQFLKSMQYVEIAAITSKANKQFASNKHCPLVKAIEEMVCHNLLSPQKLSTVIAMMSKAFFVHIIEKHVNAASHRNLLKLATIDQKIYYINQLLNLNFCIYLALGAKKGLHDIKQDAIIKLNKVTKSNSVLEKDDLIIQLRGIATTLNKQYFKRKVKDTIRSICQTLVSFDVSLKLKKATCAKREELTIYLEEMAFDHETIIEQINALTLTTEDPEAELFIDPLFGDFMRDPVILPGMGKRKRDEKDEDCEEPLRVDRSRLKKIRNSKGVVIKLVNPYNRTAFPVEEYISDQELKDRIEQYLHDKNLTL